MRQPFFGVTHLHTGLSFDASIRFVDEGAGNTPRGAYAFARGEQLAFVGAAVAACLLVRSAPLARRQLAKLSPAYAIGTLGAFWLLERSWTALQAIQHG